MYQIIILILMAGYGAIAWRNFQLAIFIFLAVLPAYLLRLTIFGIPTTVLELMFLLLAAIWLFKIKNDWEGTKPWLAPFVILLLAGIIGAVISPDKLAALGILKAYLIEPIILFFILKSILKDSDTAESAINFLGLGALSVAAFAIFQHLTGQAIPIPWDIEGRATSYFPYPNAVGLYLGPIIILGLWALKQAIKNEEYPKALFWLITAIASIAAIIFSQTEAAWVAIPAALLIFGIFFSSRKLLSTLLLVPIIILVLFSPALQSKILLQDYSGGVRLKQWEESWNMLKDNWLFGAGLSGYPTAIEPYHTHEEIEIFQYPHNLFLNIWSELGLLGIVVAIWLVFLSIKKFQRVKKQNLPNFWLAGAAVTALLEMFIHGLVDVPFFKNDLAMLTVFCLAMIAWNDNFKDGLARQRL